MCVCVLKEVWGVWEFGGTERGLSWPCPGSAVVVQSQRGSEARNVRAFGNTARAREQTERCKGIINTKSRCHSKWLFLGGSVCANIDWRVCVCMCVYKPVYHLRRGKRKRRTRTDPLSLSEALSVCNWILSLSYCCCLCLWGLEGLIFFSLRWCYITASGFYLTDKNSLVLFCQIRAFLCVWDWCKCQVTWNIQCFVQTLQV